MQIYGHKDPWKIHHPKRIIIIGPSNGLFHQIFKPPFYHHNLSDKANQERKWLNNYYNSLDWYSGTVDYYKIQSSIEKYIKDNNYYNYIVYVKGLPKLRFLQKFLSSFLALRIQNIEDENYAKQISDQDSILKCSFQRGVCAVNTVRHMRRWWENKSNTFKQRQNNVFNII